MKMIGNVNESVVGKLKKLWSREKYCIIIFSNQKYYDNDDKIRYGLRKKYKLKWIMIQKIVEQLGDLPILFNVSFGNKSRKPNRLMFDFLKRFRKKNYVFDSVNSFYVGDALGRKGDFSDSDKKFAIADSENTMHLRSICARKILKKRTSISKKHQEQL